MYGNGYPTMLRTTCCIAIVVLAAASLPAIEFRDVTSAAGLVEPLAGILGHGGAWGDYDGDGRIDIYVGGFCDRPNVEYEPASGPVSNRLFRNLGDGRFERVAASAGDIYGRTSGAVFADLDNDGDLELYVANNAKERAADDAKSADNSIQRTAKVLPSKLYRNDGGKLVDISEASGACPTMLHTARNVAVLDYDGDGLLDLYVVEDRFTSKPRSALLKNLGELKFKDVTREAGLRDDVFGLGSAIADVNDDGRPDIFVGHSNRLFLSTAGGKYKEHAALQKTFAWEPLDDEDWPCGAAFGDLNRDGLLDLVLSIHGVRARNRVYLNEGMRDGVPRFRDVTAAVGIPEEVPARCPHVEIQDFDNDGWPDVYFSAAWLDDDGNVTPLVLRNSGKEADGLPRFVAPRKIAAPMVYYPAGPSGDYDRDGRIDMFLVNWFSGNHSRLLRNESRGDNNWLRVQVIGRTVNRMGIGAKVRVYRTGKLGHSDAVLGVQEISTGFGYASGQEAVAHFGLGAESTVDVEVALPNGKTIRQSGIKARQQLVLTESN
jgi:enediyne biosynthesis protein E4